MTRKHSSVLWTARILAIALCVFLGLFALDAWEPGKPALETVRDVLIHLLPSAVILAIILLSRRRQWLAGLAFVALAVAYAVMVRFRLDWVLTISGPLLTVGLLFLWSWRKDQRFAAT